VASRLLQRVRYKSVSGVLWQNGTKRRSLDLIVLAPMPYVRGGKRNYRDPAYVLVTDPTMSIELAIQGYLDRWQIEYNHRDEKSILGVGEAQVWNELSVEKQPAFHVAAYSALLLANIISYGDKDHPDFGIRPKWRKKPKRNTCRALVGLLSFSKNRMHYTIVLAPASESKKYVEASQIYNEYQPSYLLNANGSSSPHITIVQFDCDSPEIAHKVWADMCEQMRKENFGSFIPSFVGMSFIEGLGLYVGTTWVELSVQKGDIDSPLMKAHHAALASLKKFGLEPLNAVGNNYRPHLTLARIVMPKHIPVWSKNLFENPENFNLEFGLSDEKWQYAKTISIFFPKNFSSELSR
jgi:hypothetical protein